MPWVQFIENYSHDFRPWRGVCIDYKVTGKPELVPRPVAIKAKAEGKALPASNPRRATEGD